MFLIRTAVAIFLNPDISKSGDDSTNRSPMTALYSIATDGSICPNIEDRKEDIKCKYDVNIEDEKVRIF